MSIHLYISIAIDMFLSIYLNNQIIKQQNKKINKIIREKAKKKPRKSQEKAKKKPRKKQEKKQRKKAFEVPIQFYNP